MSNAPIIVSSALTFLIVLLIAGYVGYRHYNVSTEEEAVIVVPKVPEEEQEIVVNKPKKLIVYYSDWSIYGRQFYPWNVDWNRVTHVQFAFLDVKDDKLVLYDPWADVDKVFPEDEGKEPTTLAEAKGVLGALLNLKKRHRGVKVMASIGGWTLSKNMVTVLRTPEAMDTFVASCVEMCKLYTFDGIDLDLEENEGVVIDVAKYRDLIVKLRKALTEANPSYQLSIAYQCTASLLERSKPYLKEIAENLDHFSLMTYDFSGSWSTTASHQSNLYDSSVTGYSADSAVRTLKEAGVPAWKICIGVALYSRDYLKATGLHGTFEGIPSAPAGISEQYASGVWENGTTDYKRLPKAGQMELWDDSAKAGYAFGGGVLSTYDTVKAVEAKADYVNAKGLGGLLYWEASGDHPSGHPKSLVLAAYNKFAGNTDSTLNLI